MEKEKEREIHFVVEQLIKIMNDRKLTKSAFAELIGFQEAKWNKISNGIQSLKIEELSNIAEKLRLREIDIYTWPHTYIELDKKGDDVKAQLTIELRDEVKQQVLELIFGNKNVQLLNEKKKG